MKAITKPVEPPAPEMADISCYSHEGKVWLSIVRDSGRVDEMSFHPGEAVKLWRCMMGECDYASLTDPQGRKYKMWCHVHPHLGEVWEFREDLGEEFFCFDADQALAFAWALVRCCGESLCTRDPAAKKQASGPTYVWVLASRRIFTGDCAENGREQLGGTERVFATKAAALDALREFLRPLVNDCHSESHWEELEDSAHRDVDDVLDDILDEGGHPDAWMYDGTKQSFEVTLARVEVERAR